MTKSATELSRMRQALAPDIDASFRRLSETVSRDDALSCKAQQLLAVAMAHVTQCPYGIRVHVRAAMIEGATIEQITEAIWVSAEIGVGRAVADSTLALDTLDAMKPHGDVAAWEDVMSERTQQRVNLKRAYEAASSSDGRRVLVDRIWPRGITKKDLRIHEWVKDLAPSAALRKWFAHDPTRWTTFKQRYFRELDERPDAIARIGATGRNGTLTLVFAAKDTLHNNAVALKEYIERHRRNPSRPASADHQPVVTR